MSTYLKQGSLHEGVRSIATSGGTTTLTASDKTHQRFTGTSTHTVKLPDATTLANGRRFLISNHSTMSVTVQYNDGSTAATLTSDTASEYRLISNASTNGDFDIVSMGSGGGTPGGADSQIQYNNGGAFGGDSAFTFDDTKKAVLLSGGTLTSTADRWFKTTGTFPNTAGSWAGVTIDVTSSGTSPSAVRGTTLNLGSGYTGTGSTFGVAIGNQASGTATLNWSTPSGNYGLNVEAGATSGSIEIIGISGTVYNNGVNPSKGIGVVGCILATTTAAVGVFGQTIVGSTGFIGGYFMTSTTATTTLPSLGSFKCALLADNSNGTNDIFQCRSGTGGPTVNDAVFVVQDDGDVIAVTGNVQIVTNGKGIQIAEGANARMGEATLVAGTVTVSNTSVTATTRIFLSRRTLGTLAGFLSYTLSAATSFTITSSSVTDDGIITWMLVEPA